MGTDMNHTVTLWSSFRISSSSSGGEEEIKMPMRLRVFGMRPVGIDRTLVPNMMSMEVCPAPYRPSSSLSHVVPASGNGGKLGGLFGGGKKDVNGEEDVAPPSSFVVLAERNVGVVHALHIGSLWVEDGGGGGENDDAASMVAVVGFDYVTTLNVVHPVYSFCVSPPSSISKVGNGTLGEERDVDLCCLQSKAVQMLTLSAGIVAPPELGGEGTDQTPGVTVLGLPTAVSGDELDGEYEDYEDDDGDVGEETYEDDYDVEEDGPDSGNEEDHESNMVAPTTNIDTSNESDNFSNWLCAIAVPTPPPAVDKPAKVPHRVGSTPPGLGFSLSSTTRTNSAASADFPSVMPPGPYLLPDQVLDTPTTKREIASILLPPVPPLPAAMSSSAIKPAKTSNKKTGQDGIKKANTVPSNQTAAPMKLLLRQEPKQESASNPPPPSASISAGSSITDLGAVKAAVTSQMKSHETQILSSLQKAIVSEVASTVRSSFMDSQKATEQAVLRGITLGLSSEFDTDQDGKFGKTLEKVAKESAASAVTEAVASIQPLIMKSLQQTMREVMIPSYEAATRQMFQQTSSVLEQGLKEMASNQTNASASTMQAMLSQMAKMSDAIQSLSMEVVQLRGTVDAKGVYQTASAPREVQEVVAPPMGIRDEIAALCRAQRYEEAFTIAVSASDGALVLFACNNADTEAVFNGDVHISQPIMICLLQQLGAILVPATDAGDIKTILTWLQEIAVTIDPSNINIQRHVGNVVHQLLAIINTKMSTNCDPDFRRPMQMLVQVIRGLHQ